MSLRFPAAHDAGTPAGGPVRHHAPLAGGTLPAVRVGPDGPDGAPVLAVAAAAGLVVTASKPHLLPSGIDIVTPRQAPGRLTGDRIG